MSLPQEPVEYLLEALRRVDVDQWRRELRALLTAHEDLESAAQALRVGSGTLERWLRSDPGLADLIREEQ